MKILHTSDWHLGHILYNESQEDSHQSMLSQITDIIINQQPDVLIISGDVYDTTQPSASIQQLFANAIVKMHEACKEMTIVCIAGNHDSGSKHMIFHTPWKALNVHMVGSITKDCDLDDYIIPVNGKGFVVAVPFAVERYMPDEVFRKLSDMVAKRNPDDLPVVLSCHLAVLTSDWRGHDHSSDTNIGGLNCQDLSVFGDDYDYIALGHIHKQQQLDREGHVWYSGTPIAISFDEVYAGNQHGVLLAECKQHKEPVSVKSLTIDNPHPLVNLPFEGFAAWNDVKAMLEKYDGTIASFIRLNVEVDDYLQVGAYDEAQQIIEDKNCRLCIINSKRKEVSEQKDKVTMLTTTQLKQADFVDVAKMYIESRGEVFDDEMKLMLQEVKEMLNANEE
jgi:exonuclease SbcD